MRRAVAARYGGPEVLTVVDSAIPRPCSNQLLIRVAATTVNPIDRWMLRGYGRRLFPMVGVAPPFTLGRDIVGEVVDMGPLAWRFYKGQMVAAATHPTQVEGAHAEYTLCAETAAAPLPPGLTSEDAAPLPFAALTAWRALRGLANVKPGQTVTVHGAAGSVGSFASQYLSHFGCHVIATCRPKQINRVKEDCAGAAAKSETSANPALVLSVEDFLACAAQQPQCAALVLDTDTCRRLEFASPGPRVLLTPWTSDRMSSRVMLCWMDWGVMWLTEPCSRTHAVCSGRAATCVI
jgi:NADPH:quinone reductase-like Zn-dependent oxidoreductase